MPNRHWPAYPAPLAPTVVFAIIAAFQGWYLFGEGHRWAKDVLDPRRSASS